MIHEGFPDHEVIKTMEIKVKRVLMLSLDDNIT